jgi:sugar phosphate isomerase/epimerase
MKISLSIQTPDVESPLPLALLTGTFEEKCERAAEFGADGVEIITTNPSRINQIEIRKCLEKYHLFPAAISSGGIASTQGLTLLNADSSKAESAYHRMEDLIRFAGELGSPTVTIGSFRGRMRIESGMSPNDLTEILHRGGNFARENGTRLAIEPLNRYETDFIINTRQGLDFLQAVDHPSVGLLIDTFHANIEESSRTEPFRHALDAKKLFHVHIADNNRLAPGAGLIDFSGILRLLSRKKYEGFISAELFPRPDPDTAAQLTLSYLHNILDKL